MKSARKFGLSVFAMTSALMSTAVITSSYIPQAQAANLVVNGDFTADSLLNPTDITRNNPFITGWFNSEFADTYYTTYLDNYTVDNAEDKSLSVRFGASTDFTYISQDLKTVAGQKYQLNYYLANIDEENLNEFETYVGGQLLDRKINVPFQGFTPYTYDFVATSDLTQLKFASKQGKAWYNLDNVSVTAAVPEPSILGGIAVLGLMGIRLKKKRLASYLKSN
ncbi:hypothetical protein A6770_05100 [Nostoc minutum NIES-26]|uniref:DUF642 domain-containing protein n=1 Tax=Nostoc minutum NIES-26 TaxID=1844469 RepID=A0A367QFE9_9NOSO|nr:hypothetical protein A6770_05100 [Nostoc minutum NIES-26]